MHRSRSVFVLTKPNSATLHSVFQSCRPSRFAPDGRKNQKPFTMKRNKKIEIRVSQFEKNEISKKAENVGINISEYLRKSGLEKQLNFRFSKEEIDAWKDLTSISNSLKNLTNILSKENREELIRELKLINEQIKIEIQKFLR